MGMASAGEVGRGEVQTFSGAYESPWGVQRQQGALELAASQSGHSLYSPPAAKSSFSLLCCSPYFSLIRIYSASSCRSAAWAALAGSARRPLSSCTARAMYSRAVAVAERKPPRCAMHTVICVTAAGWLRSPAINARMACRSSGPAAASARNSGRVSLPSLKSLPNSSRSAGRSGF